jgi:hypothetical protein
MVAVDTRRAGVRARLDFLHMIYLNSKNKKYQGFEV